MELLAEQFPTLWVESGPAREPPPGSPSIQDLTLYRCKRMTMRILRAGRDIR